MNKVRQLLRHPAGKVGLMMGLAIGVVAALMGEASKALLLVGLCRFVAKRFGR